MVSIFIQGFFISCKPPILIKNSIYNSYLAKILTLLDNMYIIIHMFTYVNKRRVLQNPKKKILIFKNKLNNTKL